MHALTMLTEVLKDKQLNCAILQVLIKWDCLLNGTVIVLQGLIAIELNS